MSSELFCSAGEAVAAVRADGQRAGEDLGLAEDVPRAVLVVPVRPGGELLLRLQVSRLMNYCLSALKLII